MSENKESNYTIGIDEVGRGPIAGPVVVCACAIMEGLNVLSLFPKNILKDSKKLSEKKRNEIVKNIEELVVDNKIIFGIGEVDAKQIDDIGIVSSIKESISIALKKIFEGGVSNKSKIFLDGGLKAPVIYLNQETIIKGDEKIPEIALASIIAKVYRDNLMKKLSSDFPLYGFENHVGYGTKAHYKAIQTYGFTLHHRKSFLKKLL